MKNLTVLLLSTIILYSCSEKKTRSISENEEQTVKQLVFQVDSIEVTDSLAVNNMLSGTYSAKLLVFPTIKDKSVLDSIYGGEKFPKEYTKKGLMSFLEKQKAEYFENLKRQNTDLAYNFPQKFYQNWDMKLISSKYNYVQIEQLFSSFEGGAHGNYYFQHEVFDLVHNRKLQLSDITTIPSAHLSDLLKKYINTNLSGVKDNMGPVNYSDMLLVKVIPPTENFYFDENNLYFHYSPYEIAAYAAGDIIIPVKWEDLKGTLQKDFTKRTQIK